MFRYLAALVVVVTVLIPASTALAQGESGGNGKDYGVAINPVLALFGWFAAEFNVWRLDRTGEINIPAMYVHDPFYIDEGDYSIDIFMTGTYYRKFFDASQEGFFVQAGWNYYHASVDGKGPAEGDSAGADQAAILFGMGYRAISQTNGLFWAFGFAAGRRWGTIEDTLGNEIQDGGLAVSVDLLKIGYSW